MRRELRERIEAYFNAPLSSLSPLSGGCLSQCIRAQIANQTIVVKLAPQTSPQTSPLGEARMLSDLNVALHSTSCRAPKVYFADTEILVMEWIEHQPLHNISPQTQALAGQIIATLHSHSDGHFGYPYDTSLGSFRQNNKPCTVWHRFYTEQRLSPAVEAAFRAGHLPETLRARLDNLTEHFETLLAAKQRRLTPSLLHGDLWGGNMLWTARGLQGLIDPALYYGDSEVDLALLCLFPCLDEAFFEGYARVRSIAPEFWQIRKHCYALYPLVLHCLFFGQRYCALLARTLHQIERAIGSHRD